MLGALVNSIFLIALCFSILIEAIQRFIKHEPIEQVHLLLYVACTGLAVNLIGLFIFGHGHSHGSHSHAEIKKLEDLNENSYDSVDVDADLSLKAISTNETSKTLVNENKTKINYEEKSRKKCCSILCKLFLLIFFNSNN